MDLKWSTSTISTEKPCAACSPVSAVAAASLDPARVQALARAGFELGQVPLAAIEAGGGSLRCCVAEVF